MIGTAIRFLVGLLLAVVLIPAGVLLVDAARERAAGTWPEDAPFLAAGLLVGVLLMVINRRPRWLWWFSHTFLHELAHALACLALGVRIRSFKVTAGNGGAVVYDRTGPVRTTLIAMAPYTLPLLPLPLLIVQHLCGEAPWRGWISAACGWAMVAHLHGLWKNLRLNYAAADGDLAVSGRLLGLVLVVAALLLLAAAALAALWSSARVVPGWPV